MKRFLLLISLVAVRPAMALAQDAPCPVSTAKDTDGVLLCPDLVRTGSAWAVFRCGMEQKSWHQATAPEKTALRSFLEAFKAQAGSKYPGSVQAFGGQICRVVDGDDRYVLVWAAAGVRDYGGPNLILRETAHSRISLIGPHDDSDGTAVDTKWAIQKTSAFALVANGHRRRSTDGDLGDGERHYPSDFVHNAGDNLGWFAVKWISELWPDMAWMHVHGQSNSKSIGYRPKSTKFADAYEAACRRETGVDNFYNLNADFAVDPGNGALPAGTTYVKSEVPTKIHQDRPLVLSKIVADLENAGWGK